jgi:small subunit ribosomal protein S21
LRNNDYENTTGLTGTRVEVKNNDFSRALRKFKKKVQDNNILQEVKNREFYEKPSVVKKRKQAAARSRWLKKMRESEI